MRTSDPDNGRVRSKKPHSRNPKILEVTDCFRYFHCAKTFSFFFVENTWYPPKTGLASTNALPYRVDLSLSFLLEVRYSNNHWIRDYLSKSWSVIASLNLKIVKLRPKSYNYFGFHDAPKSRTFSWLWAIALRPTRSQTSSQVLNMHLHFCCAISAFVFYAW